MTPGKPASLLVNGKTYTLSAIVRDLIFQFRDFIAEVEGCEIKHRWVRAKDQGIYETLTVAEQVAWRKRTEFLRIQLAGFTLGCDLYQEYLKNISGLAFWVSILLREHHPDITEYEALDVATSPDFPDAFAQCVGQLPAPPPNGAAPLPESLSQQWSKSVSLTGREPSGSSGSTTASNPASLVSVSPIPKSS